MKVRAVAGAMVVGALALPTGAQATVQLGTLDPAAANPIFSPCALGVSVAFQVATVETPNPYVVPTGGGSITSFSTKYGTIGPSFNFYVLRPDGPPLTPANSPQSYTAIFVSPPETITNADGVSTYTGFDVPVREGDVLGITSANGNLDLCYGTPSPADIYARCPFPAPVAGESRACTTHATFNQLRTNVAATLEQSTDLSLAQTAAPTAIPIGGSTKLTLIAGNLGTVASGATVVETLPAGLQPQTAGANGGTCSTAGQVVTCELNPIAAAANTQIEITAKGIATGEQTATAKISGPLGDPTPTNDTAVTTVNVFSNEFGVLGKTVAGSGKITVTIDSPQAGQYSARATTNLPSSGRSARRKGVYGIGSASAAGEGPVKLTIKPKKPAKRALAAGRTLKVNIPIAFTPATGTATQATVKARVKPKKRG